MEKLPPIIGIGGTFASGKDTLSECLAEQYGYNHVSTSDMVRATAMERYGDIERPTLQKVGVELRDEGGPGVLAERALRNPHPIVVSGIRTAGEVAAVKDADGIMVFVGADPRMRYERMISRVRDKEALVTFEEFIEKEKKELEGAKTEADQNIAAVHELSDIVLDNSGDLESFIVNAIKELSRVLE